MVVYSAGQTNGAANAPIGGKLPIALPGFFPVGHGLERPAKSAAP